MSLKDYRQKRNFSKTPEPKGKQVTGHHFLYVIQKHAASHLHYDFRLELGGVLKSWAIPKGPCLDPKVKRLAVAVEDHPVAYGHFEGIIPQGEYGGGTVMLWDNGLWHPLDEHPEQAYTKGHLRFELQGEKLKGRWDLIRFKEDKQWFLIKYQDQFAQQEHEYDVTADMPNSVVSQKSLEEITQDYQYTWSKKGLKKNRKRTKIDLPKGLTAAPFPTFIRPQLATLVDQPPNGELWVHEIKFDGYRILAFKEGPEVLLKSRNNIDWTKELKAIAEAVKQIPCINTVVDGEVVLLDEDGKSNFQLLQNAIKGEQKAPFIYYLFDLLYIERFDIRDLPLLKRKAILKELLTAAPTHLRYSDHLKEEGGEVFAHSCELALEGIVSKRIDSPYTSKRNKNWLKTKCIRRQEFIIGGYTSPRGKRSHFGALLLGYFNQHGELEYAGNVGTGFTQQSLKELAERFKHHQSTTSPFRRKPPHSAQVEWVAPVLVAEIEFSEWTEGGHLRHPTFKGLRFDKQPEQIIREQETSLKDMTMTRQNAVNISNPDKLFYPEDEISKEDVLHYYDSVSDKILPYLIDRPLTLVRCPNGYQHCFYQRHDTHTDLHSVAIQKDKKTAHYLYLTNKEELFNLVQMGVLEIHPWGSCITHIEQPDVIIFDLDPAPDVPWSRVVAAALDVREQLAQIQLTSFVKSTGGKGLHVVIPIKPEQEWDDIKEFTHVFSQFMERLKPKEYISTMSKAKRVGKIFIDYLRNQRTATAIAPYSTRARIHAPVATPLFWEELSEHPEDTFFTLKTVPQRLEQLKEDPWQHFYAIKQSLPNLT